MGDLSEGSQLRPLKLQPQVFPYHVLWACQSAELRPQNQAQRLRVSCSPLSPRRTSIYIFYFFYFLNSQSSHMVRMSRPLFLDWPWRPLCSPSQSLPLTYGPEGWILQWKGTCRQQTALHCPFDFPQAPLRGRHTLSQVPNKGHEKASAVQLPEKQGTDQSRRGPTSAVTKARTRYKHIE